MNKPAALVVAFLLLSAGIASATAITQVRKVSNPVSVAVQHERRLGPKPTPHWYWRWAQWRLGEGYARGAALQSNLRPKQMPRRVPLWAWQRLHFFLLARKASARASAGAAGQNRHKHTTPTTTTTTATTTTTPTTTTTTTPVPAGGASGDGVLMYGGHLANVTDPSQYSMLVGSAWSRDATSVVATAAGLGLVYFNGTVVNTQWSTGVPYSLASANGWLLKDSSGNFLVSKVYTSNYAADIGSPEYQQAWIANVEAYLAARPGIDGVFIDSVLYDPKADFGTYPAKYPSTSAYSAAEVSFVQAVYAALHAKGYYVALNAGAYKSGDSLYNAGTSTVNWWGELAPYADGLMDEYYAQASNRQLRASGTAWYQQWDGWQRLIGVAQSLGDDFLGLEYNGATDTTAMTYGKASFLLEWNGGGSVFMYNDGSTDPTNSAWTTDIGTPTAPKVQVGVGWERAYSGGTVLVNPSASVSQTFTVAGTSYTLAPTTARILVS